MNIGSLDKVCFGQCSMMSLHRGSFWDNQVIQTGSSGYQLHSGEQRARSGTNHTTWPRALTVCVCVCVCFRDVGGNVYFWLKEIKTFVCVCYVNKRAAEFECLPGNFPWVYRTTQLSMVFKSPLSAIRNGWFGHSNTKRLASLTMWKASGQSHSLSHT